LQLNLTFDWESLNQGVRGESFRWEHWELGKGDFVVDQRLGRDRPIYLRDFTLPDEVEIRSSNAAQPRTFHRILILGNVVLLSLGGGRSVVSDDGFALPCGASHGTGRVGTSSSGSGFGCERRTRWQRRGMNPTLQMSSGECISP